MHVFRILGLRNYCLVYGDVNEKFIPDEEFKLKDGILILLVKDESMSRDLLWVDCCTRQARN